MSTMRIIYLILGIFLVLKTMELSMEMFKAKCEIRKGERNKADYKKRKIYVLTFVLLLIILADILYIYGIHLI